MPTTHVDQILKLCKHPKTEKYYTILSGFLLGVHSEQNKEATGITSFSLF